MNYKYFNQEKDDRVAKEAAKEAQERLNSVIESQTERLEQQSYEIVKLRNLLEVNCLRSKRPVVQSCSQTEVNSGTERKTDEEKERSPTLNFLGSIKNKLESLDKVDIEINDDFEDINYQCSLQE